MFNGAIFWFHVSHSSNVLYFISSIYFTAICGIDPNTMEIQQEQSQQTVSLTPQQKWESFVKGVTCIFSRWTALCLAIEQGMGEVEFFCYRMIV